MTAVLPRALGDDLVLRVATPADADAMAVFNADILRMQDSAEPQASLGEWTKFRPNIFQAAFVAWERELKG